MKKVEEELQIIFGEKPDWKKITEEADRNGDGKIDLNEFILIVTNRAELINEENLKIAFQKLDENGDGKIDKYEMKNALQ